MGPARVLHVRTHTDTHAHTHKQRQVLALCGGDRPALVPLAEQLETMQLMSPPAPATITPLPSPPPGMRLWEYGKC